jgi:hypothetical protein
MVSSVAVLCEKATVGSAKLTVPAAIADNENRRFVFMELILI